MEVFLITLVLLVTVASLAISIASANMAMKISERLERLTPKKRSDPNGGLMDPSTAQNYVSDAEVRRQPNYTDIISQNISSSLKIIKDE